jgi:trehalose 6-phosphate synthase
VHFLQICPRSREEVDEYRKLRAELDRLAGRINGRFSELDWTPLRYSTRPAPRATLAGLYRIGRIGVVTPLRDGMNLVAKEYVAAQDETDPGVLILSRFAGAAAEFRSGALLVNPYDPESVAAAIARALDMPQDERIRRHRTLFQALLDNDIRYWGDRFLSTLVGQAKGAPGTVRAASRLQRLVRSVRESEGTELKASEAAPPA